MTKEKGLVEKSFAGKLKSCTKLYKGAGFIGVLDGCEGLNGKKGCRGFIEVKGGCEGIKKE